MPKGEREPGKQKATLVMLRSHPAAVIQSDPWASLAGAFRSYCGVSRLVLGAAARPNWSAGGGAWWGFVKPKLAVCQCSDPTPSQLPVGEPSVIQDLDVRHSHWEMTDAAWGKDCDSASGIWRERERGRFWDLERERGKFWATSKTGFQKLPSW